MADHVAQKMTIKQAIVLLVILVMLFLILWPALTASRGQPHWLRDMSNLRQISVGVYSYRADHQDYYGPGLESEGRLQDGSVENRYRALLEPGYFLPDCLISRYEYENKTEWTSGPVHSGQYSYAMLQLPEQGGRLDQWKEYPDTKGAWLSSRNTGTDAAMGVQCLETDTPGEWLGVVAWGDGHVSRETSHLMDTRYVPGGPVNEDDNLFEAVGDDDAYMIYTGN